MKSHRTLIAGLLAAAAPVLSTPAFAQSAAATDDDSHTPEDIVVTAPYIRSLDILGNVTVVEGNELASDLRAQIGDTLVRQAGVSATSFSPGASRPVLRGFQGERVRVLTDGIGSIDVSNTSADHGVTIDPLTAERIEILRGPAVLLFGSQAVGGAVNIFDRRIPRALPESPLHADIIAGYGSAADDASVGGSIDVPVAGKLALHLDGSYRTAGDVRSGGYVFAAPLRAELDALADEEETVGNSEEAAELRALSGQRGRIANSAVETVTAGAGLSIIDDGGKLGFSIGYYKSDYGVPGRPGSEHAHEDGGDGSEAEEGEAPVTIGLEQWRADVRGDVQFGGGIFDSLRIRAGYADYEHTEFEGDDVGTVFRNQGIEARAELVQVKRGGWSGATGVHFAVRDFNAIGAEAFVPANDSAQYAVFTLQEVTLGKLSLEGALRYEHARVDAAALGIRRRFDALSGAIGIGFEPAEGIKIGANIARAARAPSPEELLSNGPHIATQSFEIGDPGFALETNWGGEAYVKLKGDGYTASLTAYANRFDNYIYVDATGAEIDDLPVFQYRQQDARYWGFEFEGSANIFEAGGYTFVLDGVADYTRAELTGGGGPIPRIPPLRLRGGIEADGTALDARVEVEWIDAQRRVAGFETATDGFTLVNASVTWHPWGSGNRNAALVIAANNIFDVEARRHASFTKDFVPLFGRDIRVTLRASF